MDFLLYPKFLNGSHQMTKRVSLHNYHLRPMYISVSHYMLGEKFKRSPLIMNLYIQLFEIKLCIQES